MGLMSYSKELRELEDQGIDIIELLGQDRYLESPQDLQRIVEGLSRSGESLYAQLLQHLTCRRFKPKQAEDLWHAILRHKRRLCQALGRNVTFRVAALDHLLSRTGMIKNARLVGKPEFETLMTYVNVDEVSLAFNRRYFNEQISLEVRRARRYSSSLSLLILDIDDFKRVNDTYGHPEGDAVLRRVARLLRESTRESDTVYRYGGDEFAVLLPETNAAKAAALAGRVVKSKILVGEPTRAEKDTLTWKSMARLGGVSDPSAGASPMEVTFSIGGATYPEHCDEAEELVVLADQMCLEAKRRGKDRVRMCGLTEASGEDESSRRAAE